MTDVPKPNMPDGWQVASLCMVTEVNPKLDKFAGNDNPTVSFVPMPAVGAGTGAIDVSRTRSLQDVKKGYTHFREGDVLFAKITPCMENGKMAIVPPLKCGLGFGSTEFHVLRPSREISAQYIYWFVSSEQFRRDAQHNMTGAVGQRRVLAPYLAHQTIPVPPAREQHRIVAKIEELFSELDKGVESLKTARTQLKVYRQAVLKHAFEGKLTAQWREKNKDKLETPEQLLARIKREREARYEQLLKEWTVAVKTWEAKGKPGKKPSKPRKLTTVNTVLSSDSLVDGLTDWRWTTVSEIADLVTDGTHRTPDYAGSGVPFISVKDIRHGRVSFDDCKFISQNDHEALIQRCHPEPGDLLITKSGTIGRLAIVPDRKFSLFVSVALVKIQSAQAHISSRWLRYAFEHHIMSLNIDQQIKGGLLKNYHLEDLRLVRLPLCNFREQEELVCQIEERLSVIKEFGTTLDQQLVKADALRQSILRLAFAGQLVAQDPGDEPASTLLGRIRAEQEQAVKNNAYKKEKEEEDRRMTTAPHRFQSLELLHHPAR